MKVFLVLISSPEIPYKIAIFFVLIFRYYKDLVWGGQNTIGEVSIHFFLDIFKAFNTVLLECILLNKTTNFKILHERVWNYWSFSWIEISNFIVFFCIWLYVCLCVCTYLCLYVFVFRYPLLCRCKRRLLCIGCSSDIFHIK